MNYIDLIVIALLILYILHGIYRGFLNSLMNMGAFFVSWITAFLTYPLLSKTLVSSGLYDAVRYYIGGSDRIAGGFEVRSLSVVSLPPDQLNSIVQGSGLPSPFGDTIINNVHNAAFSGAGLTTIGDYFEATIASVIVNIVAFLIIYFILRIILTVLTNAVGYSFALPQLKHFDGLLGGGIGLLRGVFAMYVIFCIVPVILVSVPVTLISDYVNQSTVCEMFYKSSIILRFISGVV